ncbi:MAG: NAD(P)H-binding protein [Candidatus Dormibacteria bacterium]
MDGAVLVTGATGTVGRSVVSQLLDAGVIVRAVTRTPETAGLPEGVEVVRAELSEPATLQAHLDGVAAAFLVWPFVTAREANELAPAAVDAIARHASRVVYLSAMAAERTGSFWAAVERVIEASGTAWTFLRPSGFAKNALIWAEQIRRGDVVRWVYGEAARSLVHEADVAAVAVRALTEGNHAGSTYVLTGPATVTQVEQVQAIGEAIGRRLRWEEVSPDVVREELIAAVGDPSFADHALDTWAGFVDEPEPVTSTVQDVTGVPARTFRQWTADHAAEFK